MRRLKLPWVKSLLALPRHDGTSTGRAFHTSRKAPVQRLLWAGTVLDQTSASFKEVPKDWLLALGVQADVEQGISFTGLAASPSHTLLSYLTLPPNEPVATSEQQAGGSDAGTLNPAGLHKIAAIGRNTYGELGLGFASQESTWGMVARGFEGAGGICGVRCGLGSSWVATNKDSSSQSPSLLYSFGNHTSGQLGLGGDSSPHALSEGGEPQLQLFSSPRRVPSSSLLGEDVRIEDIACGLDHTIILVRRANGTQEIYTCGINTDGQLAQPAVRISSPSLARLDSTAFDPPLPPDEHDPVAGVAAGGDTSLLWTASGRIWGWGNSEYAQALVGGKAIDRIDVPTEATQAVADATGNSRIADIKLGGSFVVLLDDKGNVYTAGFGALGQGKDRVNSESPRQILAGASLIHTGLEHASAVMHGLQGGRSETQLALWGLDTGAGRLGLGARKPYPSYMIASRFTLHDIDLRIYQPALASGIKASWLGPQGEAGGTRDAREVRRRKMNDASDMDLSASKTFPANVGIIDVAHGRDAVFVLVEDGTDEVGRWDARQMF